ncbi:MAG: hypothetical protein NC221_07700 [Duncaniella sp.]|nr:hypothetical protein [Duncaniella sp.]
MTSVWPANTYARDLKNLLNGAGGSNSTGTMQGNDKIVSSILKRNDGVTAGFSLKR